jgi:chromatin segregation and condensation protein Rec8/ScpA/Scc1 (kleisin family)
MLPPHRIISLREMVSRITATLEREARVSFARIRSTCAGPQDTAVAFLAILTLMRRQAIIATQTELFGPIELRRGPATLRALNPPERDETNGDGRHRN